MLPAQRGCCDSMSAAYSALLRPLRSRVTCRNAGLHSGKRVIADKDEVGGSSPPRPTIRPPTSGNAAQPLGLSRFQLISNQSTGGGAFEQPHGSLTSGFVGHWARFPDAGLVAQRSYSALLAC